MSHDELSDTKVKNAAGEEVGFKENAEQLVKNRKTAQDNKKTATSDDVKSKEHGKMVRESEALGDTATDAVIKKIYPGATELPHALPGKQKTGEFDRIIKNGDEVVLIETKGAGSTRGNRRVDGEGTRAEQGTPEYKNSIIKNMEESVAKHKASDKYNSDPEFKKEIDALEQSIIEIKVADATGNLKYIQVTQKVKADGSLKPEIEIITFGNKSKDVGPQ